MQRELGEELLAAGNLIGLASARLKTGDVQTADGHVRDALDTLFSSRDDLAAAGALVVLALIENVDREEMTIVEAGDGYLALRKEKGWSNAEIAKKVGELLAQRAKDKGIERVVFDRSGYLYHGRVKALAEGAREGGLAF